MFEGLIGGKLYGVATQKTGKSGKPFVTAKVRVPTGDDTVFANVITFDSKTCDALVALSDGEAVSLSGSIKVGAWVDKEGQPRPSIDMVASQVLTAYHITKKRKAMAHGTQPDHGEFDHWPHQES